MGDLFKIVNNFRGLKSELPNLAIDVLDESDILIMQDRLEQGIYADGSSFPEYSETTIGIKRSTGGFISQSGNIALKDSGDFYDSMNLKKFKGFAEIDAADPDGLNERFGSNILDVSQDESNEMFEIKREQLLKNVEKYLFE